MANEKRKEANQLNEYHTASLAKAEQTKWYYTS